LPRIDADQHAGHLDVTVPMVAAAVDAAVMCSACSAVLAR
jgi:hypothetical protein